MRRNRLTLSKLKDFTAFCWTKTFPFWWTQCQAKYIFPFCGCSTTSQPATSSAWILQKMQHVPEMTEQLSQQFFNQNYLLNQQSWNFPYVNGTAFRLCMMWQCSVTQMNFPPSLLSGQMMYFVFHKTKLQEVSSTLILTSQSPFCSQDGFLAQQKAWLKETQKETLHCTQISSEEHNTSTHSWTWKSEESRLPPAKTLLEWVCKSSSSQPRDLIKVRTGWDATEFTLLVKKRPWAQVTFPRSEQSQDCRTPSCSS